MSHSIFDGLSVVSLGGTELTVQQLLDPAVIQNTVTIEDQNVTSTESTIDSLNSNYTSISVIDENYPFDDSDLFQCGKCKSQFSSLESFLIHKKSQCPYLKVKQEFANGKTVLDSNRQSDDNCSSESSLNQVTSSGSTEAALDIEPATDQDEKFACDTLEAAEAGENQTVAVVSEGKFLSLTLDGSQVFTLNENLEITATESSKIDGAKTSSSLIPSDVSLPPEDTSPTTSTIAEIVTEVVVQECSPHKKGDSREESLNESPASTLVEEATQTPSTGVVKAEEESAGIKFLFFHDRIAKSSHDTKENLNTKHRCSFCSKVFNKNFDLQQHIRSHTGEKPFQCVVCGRGFAQKSNVKKHMTTHRVWPKGALCSTLPKDPIKTVLSVTAPNDGCSDKEEIKENVMVDDSYVCPFCSMVHPSYAELRSHMKGHNDQKVYRCIQKDCDETFLDLDTFLNHLRVHVKVRYRCHTCSKVFSSLHALGSHQYEHSIYPWPKRSGASYFRCTKCMNKYSSAESLEHHLRTSRHHFPCKECQKVFSSERLLRTHLRVHDNANLFTCATCSKKFKTEYSLKSHQLIHTGERPFECQICTLAFNRKDKLKRHLLVHEAKRFKCPFKATLGCNREFRRNDKLRLHLITHTKHARDKKNTPKGSVPLKKGKKPPLWKGAEQPNPNAVKVEDSVADDFDITKHDEKDSKPTDAVQLDRFRPKVLKRAESSNLMSNKIKKRRRKKALSGVQVTDQDVGDEPNCGVGLDFAKTVVKSEYLTEFVGRNKSVCAIDNPRPSSGPRRVDTSGISPSNNAGTFPINNSGRLPVPVIKSEKQSNAGTQILDTGTQILDTGTQILDTGNNEIISVTSAVQNSASEIDSEFIVSYGTDDGAEEGQIGATENIEVIYIPFSQLLEGQEAVGISQQVKELGQESRSEIVNISQEEAVGISQEVSELGKESPQEVVACTPTAVVNGPADGVKEFVQVDINEALEPLSYTIPSSSSNGSGVNSIFVVKDATSTLHSYVYNSKIGRPCI